MYVLISCLSYVDGLLIYANDELNQGTEYEGKLKEIFAPILFLASSEDREKIEALKTTAQEKEDLLRKVHDELQEQIDAWKDENPNPTPSLMDMVRATDKSSTKEERQAYHDEVHETFFYPYQEKLGNAKEEIEQQLATKYSLPIEEIYQYRHERHFAIVEVPSV